MTLETGKPLIESVDCIEWVAACFDYYAELGRRSYGNSIPPVQPHQVNFTIKEPYGVVAAIVPFNFPLLLMAWKVAPALAAGNTLVCKPPHQNPLCNLLLAECYDELPPGVVNVITGGAHTGELLVRHPQVDLVAFTGSVAAGRNIAALAGQELKKVNLELGSVDPFIVFADADLDVAVPGVAWARLLNAGQVCTSAKRIYLVAPVAAEFTRRLERYVRSLTVGDPQRPDTDIGPLISAEALALVEQQVAAAMRLRSDAACGRQASLSSGLKGHFFEPTILTDVPHGSLPTTEEIFGPVLSLTVAPGRRRGDRDGQRLALRPGRQRVHAQSRAGAQGDGEHQGGDLLGERPAHRQRGRTVRDALERGRTRAGGRRTRRVSRAETRPHRL
jgi:betaine-aldehyde dehydrogenase